MSKKSYMNFENLLSEGNFLQDLLKLKKSGNFKALKRMTKDKNAIQALKDLNDAAEKLEKIGKKKYGSKYKANRYKLIDFFI